MATAELGYGAFTDQIPSASAPSRNGGICIMSSTWRDQQQPSFINFISKFLSANSYRLNVVPISPDLIFNCGGVSVACVFITSWESSSNVHVFSRVKKLKGQFAHLYVVVTVPTREQNDSFVCSYFQSGNEIGKPTFVPVQDPEMGFEKIVKIAHSRGACKQHDALSKLKAERKRSVQGMDVFLRVVMSIPSIDKHDANALNQAVGSIEAIATSSKEVIIENTDLSSEKAEIVTRFLRDSKFYLSPKIN